MPAESPLTYQDIRRAAQEATTNLQTALSDLQNILRAVKNDTAILNDVHTRTTNAERSAYTLQQMQQRFELHTQLVHNMIDAVHHLHQTTTDLQQRVVNIERLASAMSMYLNEVYEHIVVPQDQKR